jgi:hypothetical protein
MRPLAVVLAVALVLASSGTALAGTLRTAAFPGDDIVQGLAQCAVTNESSRAGDVTATLYDSVGFVMTVKTQSGLAPHATVFGNAFDLASFSPIHCECQVPSTTTYRCAFVYHDKTTSPNAVMVISAP